jgi:hypothetical protein
VDRLMTLAQTASMPQVRALALYELNGLTSALPRAGGAEHEAHRMMLAQDITRFIERPMEPLPARPTPAPSTPPGAPIGAFDMDWLLLCDIGW